MKEVEKQGDLPRYLFHKGENFTAYDYLGAHRLKDGGVVFRVWAPRAQGVYLVCDTLGWETGREMQKLSDEGIWETTLSEAKSPEGMRYKFRVVSAAGVKFKSDPYAFYSETLQTLLFSIPGAIIPSKMKNILKRGERSPKAGTTIRLR